MQVYIFICGNNVSGINARNLGSGHDGKRNENTRLS